MFNDDGMVVLLRRGMFSCDGAVAAPHIDNLRGTYDQLTFQIPSGALTTQMPLQKADRVSTWQDTKRTDTGARQFPFIVARSCPSATWQL
jgi:hypothetical protein